MSSDPTPRPRRTPADDRPEHPGPPPQIVRPPAVIVSPVAIAESRRRNWIDVANKWLANCVDASMLALRGIRRWPLKRLAVPAVLVAAFVIGRWSATESESHRNARAAREGRAILAGGAPEWQRASREGQYWACAEDVMRRKPELAQAAKADDLRAQARHLLADVDHCYSIFEKNGRTVPTPFAEAVDLALFIEGDEQKAAAKTSEERAKRQALQDAADLLVSAARENKGTIQVTESPQGVRIVAGKAFCEGSDPREAARWRDAMTRLRREDLIELATRDHAGRMTYEKWRVTAAGYRLADQAK